MEKKKIPTVRPKPAPPVFFDMKHSNNAARIRIWLALKGLPPGKGFCQY